MIKISQEGINRFRAEGLAPIDEKELEGHTEKHEKEVFGLKLVQSLNLKTMHCIFTLENQIWDTATISKDMIEEGFKTFANSGIYYLFSMYPFLKDFIIDVKA